MNSNLKIKLKIYFSKYFTHTITFPKNNFLKKFERDMSYFL